MKKVKVSEIVDRFERAVRDHEMVGAAEPSERQSIVDEYHAAHKMLWSAVRGQVVEVDEETWRKG